MNNLLIFIVLIIFLIIFVAKVYIIDTDKLEHLTAQSDEAVQNLASLYNKDHLTIGKLQLGDKFLLSGSGDAWADDEWLRLAKTDGSKELSGGLAAGKLFDGRLGDIKNVVDGIKGDINKTRTDLTNRANSLDGKINTFRTPHCNWNGWRTFCGNCSDKKDDFNLYCSGGRLTHFNVKDTRSFYRP